MRTVLLPFKSFLVLLCMVLVVSCSTDTDTETQTTDEIEESNDENTDGEGNLETPLDTDNDGIPDNEDEDADGDGLVEVNSLDGLNAIRNSLGNSGKTFRGVAKNDFIGFELTQDLDFENPDHYDDISLLESYTTGKGWVPIGNRNPDSFIDTSLYFNLVLEGNGFIVRNLFINNSEDFRSSGLFGVAGSGSIIRNLALENVSIATESFDVAGLVGYSYGTIELCSVTGSVSGRSNIGLLVGGFEGISISDCNSVGAVIGIDIPVSRSSHVGGLVGAIAYLNPGGSTSSTITVSNCFSTAAVTGSREVGGLIGLIGADAAPDTYEITISNSYATGNVTGWLRTGGLIGGSAATVTTSCYATGNISNTKEDGRASAGGLIGSNGQGTITSCYATGNVNNAFNGEYLGGLLGTARSTTLTSSYSIGSVTGGLEISNGALVGINETNVPNSIDGTNYWNVDASVINTSEGEAVGLTTAELQAPVSNTGIYSEWDPAVWDFGTSNQYPALRDMPNGVENQR